eukprot:TRINITY_DN4551_c0_g1_i4.p1 TRINITY_DN4551_c0_g1~~TRINITY_DN4551_c0_g1_i4.p1  ORF type:complete len:124 (+),score=18.07 TRINITY_DN4551_c0_g1_i4:85-456(+)
MASARSSGEVLMIGPSGSGKSLLLKRLLAYSGTRSEPEFVETTPTIGVEIEDITYNGKVMAIRELGGSFMQVWPRYYANAKCILYLLDISNPTQLSTAVYELTVLVEDPNLSGKPVMIILSKK